MERRVCNECASSVRNSVMCGCGGSIRKVYFLYIIRCNRGISKFWQKYMKISCIAASHRDISYLESRILFGIVSACMIIYALLNREITFQGDSFETWEVAKHFYDPGRSFSFVEYRGNFVFIYYNAIYFISQLIQVNDILFFRLYSSILFGLLTVYIFPYFISYILDSKATVFKILLFSSVIFLYFRGYFLHPQTDVIALALFLLSLNSLIFVIKSQKDRWPIFAGAAALFASSVMTRFNYILAAPFIIAFISIALSESGKSKSDIVKSLLSFLVPFIILIGVHSASSPSHANLLRLQLWYGVIISKIEWNAGDPKYPEQLIIPDRRGGEIARLSGLGSDLTMDSVTDEKYSAAQYFSLWKNYPLDMVVISFQHLFNGLDITYPTVYNYKLNSSRFLLSIGNYIMFFIALVILSNKLLDWRSDGKRYPPLLLAMIVPVVAAIPFGIEVRYFLPIIMTYFAISIFSLNNGVKLIRAHRLYVYLIVFVILCFINSANVFSAAKYVIPLTIF